MRASEAGNPPWQAELLTAAEILILLRTWARPRKQNALDARVSILAQQFGGALVQAVREHLAAEEVSRLVNGSAARNGSPRSSSTSTANGGRLRRGSVNERVLAQLMGAIKASPGLRSELLYKKVSMPRKLAKARLAKLREQKKVKIKGAKRAAVYSFVIHH